MLFFILSLWVIPFAVVLRSIQTKRYGLALAVSSCMFASIFVLNLAVSAISDRSHDISTLGAMSLIISIAGLQLFGLLSPLLLLCVPRGDIEYTPPLGKAYLVNSKTLPGNTTEWIVRRFDQRL